MKKNGFISMSIVYSFFVVFAILASLLLANYAHNRSLIREINNDIKKELSGLNQGKVLKYTNILKNNDFETSADWILSSNVFFAPQNYLSGEKSLSFVVTPNEMTASQKVNIVSNHQYYFSCMHLIPLSSTTDYSKVILTNGSQTINLISSLNSGEVKTWQKISSNVITMPSNASDTEWQIIISEKNRDKGPAFIDNILLIDLTDNNESVPTKAWLDANVDYFPTTKTFVKTY